MTKELAKTLTTALVQFIDENRPEGTMDCSSGECERLEKAFEIYNLDFVERFIEKKLSRLTEFEKGLINFYNKSKEIPSDKDGVYNKHDLEEFLHESAKTLLALAREQFKPEIDAEIEKAYKTQDNVVFHKGWEQGRTDALKDLPRWKKYNLHDPYNDSAFRIFADFGGDGYISTDLTDFGKGPTHYIDYRELRKLPKEDKK